MCKPAFSYDNNPMAEAIAECIHNEKRREILHAVLINGWSYECAAEKTGYSARHVGRIIAQESPKLQDWLCQKMS